jgi:hypothetical protein
MPFDETEVDITKVFVVNATDASHIQTAVRFAKEKNIALVIKSTGHSFIGR